MNRNPVSSLLSPSVSPAATFLGELSQLQHQNPRQFSKVLTQITGRLKQAAESAAVSGDSQKAAQFNQLAASLQNATSAS
jgi:hypothetical protein